MASRFSSRTFLLCLTCLRTSPASSNIDVGGWMLFRMLGLFKGAALTAITSTGSGGCERGGKDWEILDAFKWLCIFWGGKQTVFVRVPLQRKNMINMFNGMLLWAIRGERCCSVFFGGVVFFRGDRKHFQDSTIRIFSADRPVVQIFICSAKIFNSLSTKQILLLLKSWLVTYNILYLINIAIN